jgi:hypothetical protein
MAVNKKAFQVDGVVLKGSAEATSFNKLENVDVGLFTDVNGNMVIRDKYVTDILKKESITLKELYTRVKGIYSRLNADGETELLFKDDTVSRPYSLNEIVNACQNWRKFLTSGSLWWVGRAEIDHSSCANLPRKDDIDGALRVWSIDRYLAQLNNIQKCTSVTPLSFFDMTIDKSTGQAKWWDVQNLEIVVPPTDNYKAALIMTKLVFGGYNINEPVMFRLYDATTGTELVRTAVTQSNAGKLAYPLPLTYFGPMPTGGSTNRFADVTVKSSQSCEEDCGCNTVSCTTTDAFCTTATPSKTSSQIFAAGSHLIKVQFRVLDYHPDHWERTFGIEFDNGSGVSEYATTSTIDAVIFNTSPDSKYTRLQGSASFEDATELKVVFDANLANNSYSITLSPDNNINCWYTAKTTSGFTIKTELPFRGKVDWTLINNAGG